MKTAFIGSLVLIGITGGTPADPLADLIAVAKPVGEVPAFANEYVRISYAWFEYPPADRRVSESRPLVLYIRVAPEAGLVNTRLLDPPSKGRPSWRLGAVPRAIHVELLKPPPRPSTLGEPGTKPPRDAIAEERRHG